jgi:hypothetical protein
VATRRLPEGGLQFARWLVGLVAVGVTLLAVAIKAIPTLVPPLTRWHLGIVEGWHLVLALAGLLWLAYGLLVAAITIRPAEPSKFLILGTPEDSEIPDHEELKEVWRKRLSKAQRALLVDMLTEPRLYSVRASEKLEYRGRSLQITVNSTLSIPPEFDKQVIVVPALMQRRGRLTNQLSVRDASGREVSTLSRPDTEAILSMLVGLLLRDLLKTAKSPEALRGEAETLSSLITLADGFLESSDPQGVEFQHTLGAALEALEAPAGLDKRGVKATLEMLALLAESYPILVVLGPLGKDECAPALLRFTVARTEMPVFQSRGGRIALQQLLRNVLDACRRWLGVHPPSLIHQLSLADRARSYHLQVVAPPGLFSSDVRVRLRPDGDTRAGSEPRLAARSLTTSPKSGQPYAHVYVQDGMAMTYFESTTSFREVSPGSVGEALVSSGVFAVFMIAVTLTHGALADSELFAFLVPLVLTGIGATSIWQGVIHTREPFGGRAAARLSSIVTLVLTLWAVGISARGLGLGDFKVRSSVPTWLPSLELQWSWVLVLALVNVGVMFVTWAIAVRIEMSMLNARPEARPRRSNRKSTASSPADGEYGKVPL